LASKPQRNAETVEVNYDAEHWSLLRGFRQKAAHILEALENRHLNAIVHGSIARGDVDKDSDIDVFIPDASGSFQVETALETAGIRFAGRSAIQATPVYAMKAYIEVDEATTVSFPLMRMRKVEREFYRFSGEATLADLRLNQRVLGVDKRLMLIEPTSKGHVESSILGREQPTAKLLGIAVETVRDRVRALTRRDAVGRTGVFVKRELLPHETFEMVLKDLAMENPAVRRRLKS
jgi:predicted nucleotidyltransferase